MLGFVVQRLFYLVPVLLAVSLLTFLIASLLPGDLAYVILGDQATPEKVEALRHDMGLDQPIWWRYASWLGHVLQGDFGRSFRTGQTVLQAVAERLPVSLELMILAEIIGLAVGVPVVVSDFPVMRRVVLDDPAGPLGGVCDPARPESIATAISTIIELPADERAALGARCLQAAHERWNWEGESSRLIALYAELRATA